MNFSEIVDQARALLQRTGKITYGVLKREFALDDESLEDLKEQFINAEEVAVDKDGKILVWVGDGAMPVSRSTFEVSSPQSPTLNPQPPASYTPLHWLTDKTMLRSSRKSG